MDVGAHSESYGRSLNRMDKHSFEGPIITNDLVPMKSLSRTFAVEIANNVSTYGLILGLFVLIYYYIDTYRGRYSIVMHI